MKKTTNLAHSKQASQNDLLEEYEKLASKVKDEFKQQVLERQNKEKILLEKQFEKQSRARRLARRRNSSWQKIMQVCNENLNLVLSAVPELKDAVDKSLAGGMVCLYSIEHNSYEHKHEEYEYEESEGASSDIDFYLVKNEKTGLYSIDITSFNNNSDIHDKPKCFRHHRNLYNLFTESFSSDEFQRYNIKEAIHFLRLFTNTKELIACLFKEFIAL